MNHATRGRLQTRAVASLQRSGARSQAPDGPSVRRGFQTRPLMNLATEGGFKTCPHTRMGLEMTCNPEKRRRRSIRLSGYNYSSAGAYFVTLCTHGRRCLLSEIVKGEMKLNDAGLTVLEVWGQLPDHYPHVLLDWFVIMPNHVHGIIVLNDDYGKRAGLNPAPTGNKVHGLPEIVRAFKTFSSRRINRLQGTRGEPVWQRNYYEHVIRSDKGLNAVRQYIEANPSQWENDPENPDAIGSPLAGAGFKPSCW